MERVEFRTCHPKIAIELNPINGYIDIFDYANGYSTTFHKSEIETYIELIDSIDRVDCATFLTEDFEHNFRQHFEGNFINTDRIDIILDYLAQFADKFNLIDSKIDIENINKKQLEDMSIYKLNYLYKKIKNGG